MNTSITENFLTVCTSIASGDTVAEACRSAGVAERSFFRALATDGDGPIAQAYAVGRKCRADKRASEIEDLARRACLPRTHADYLEPNAARVAVDALKWLASRENQSRYGDRVAVDTGTPATPGLSRSEALAALQAGSISVEEVLGKWTRRLTPCPWS